METRHDNGNENLQKLTDAGMFRKTPLPERYQEVIRELPEDAVDALIEVKERFDKAGLSPETSDFTEFIHWF